MDEDGHVRRMRGLHEIAYRVEARHRHFIDFANPRS